MTAATKWGLGVVASMLVVLLFAVGVTIASTPPVDPCDLRLTAEGTYEFYGDCTGLVPANKPQVFFEDEGYQIRINCNPEAD